MFCTRLGTIEKRHMFTVICKTREKNLKEKQYVFALQSSMFGIQHFLLDQLCTFTGLWVQNKFLVAQICHMFFWKKFVIYQWTVNSKHFLVHHVLFFSSMLVFLCLISSQSHLMFSVQLNYRVLTYCYQYFFILEVYE